VRRIGVDEQRQKADFLPFSSFEYFLLSFRIATLENEMISTCWMLESAVGATESASEMKNKHLTDHTLSTNRVGGGNGNEFDGSGTE
jgi:hypothetical protein